MNENDQNTIEIKESFGCLGCIGDRCPYYFVGDIGDATGKEYCGIGKDGLLSYGKDTKKIEDMMYCPVHSSYEEYLLTR